MNLTRVRVREFDAERKRKISTVEDKIIGTKKGVMKPYIFQIKYHCILLGALIKDLKSLIVLNILTTSPI